MLLDPAITISIGVTRGIESEQCLKNRTDTPTALQATNQVRQRKGHKWLKQLKFWTKGPWTFFVKGT